jgi:hypothetical protein
MQVAIITKNIEEMAQNFSKLFGVPMPEIKYVGGVDTTPIFYKGERIKDHTTKICTIKMGGVNLELTQPEGGTTAWQDFYDTHGEGVHHIGFIVESRDEAMKACKDMGIDELHAGWFPTASYTFMDSQKKLGVRLNIKHNNEDNADKLLK